MILAAGLLVLAGLGLFVGGLATGTTSYYWGCVACCAAAAVLLMAVRLRPGSRIAPAADDEPPARSAERAGARSGTATRTATAEAAVPAATVTDEPAGRHSGAGAGTEPDAVVDRAPAAGGTPARTTGAGDDGEDPAEEDVEVTDLLLVVDLRDQVLVVDEHPRYHLADCPWLRGRATIPLPVAEARTDGFTPCAVCSPDRHLADLARARK